MALRHMHTFYYHGAAELHGRAPFDPEQLLVGDVISAEIMRVQNDRVVVDIGVDSEQQLPLEAFRNDLGEVDAEPGQLVTVAISSIDRDSGTFQLSRVDKKHVETWDRLERAVVEGTLVQGTIISEARGGFIV